MIQHYGSIEGRSRGTIRAVSTARKLKNSKLVFLKVQISYGRAVTLDPPSCFQMGNKNRSRFFVFQYRFFLLISEGN